ncbi:hypothetical protein Csa_002027 [Cucumis sativus]|nr:hypothetical protein Csa_002027 [Cucumis sativus]
MAPPPGPYSGTSTLALVARASAFSFGLVYGSIKLKVLKPLEIKANQSLSKKLLNILHTIKSLDSGNIQMKNRQQRYGSIVNLAYPDE